MSTSKRIFRNIDRVQRNVYSQTFECECLNDSETVIVTLTASEPFNAPKRYPPHCKILRKKRNEELFLAVETALQNYYDAFVQRVPHASVKL